MSQFLEGQPIPINVQAKSLTKIIAFEAGLFERGFLGGLPIWLAESHRSKSLRKISKEIGVSRWVVTRLFDHYKIPWSSQPEASRKSLEKLRQDSEYTAKMATVNQDRFRNLREDPQFEVTRLKALRDALDTPEFKQKRSVAQTKAWREHPELYANTRIASRQALLTLWADPKRRVQQITKIKDVVSDIDVKKRHSEKSKQNWKDTEYRKKVTAAIHTRKNDPNWLERQAEIVREALAQTSPSQRYASLPSVHGLRRDLDFYALSTYEANFARILLMLGRDFYSRETFILRVTNQYKALFKTKTTQFDLDFVVLNPRNQLVIYEIMAHPNEDPIGWAKVRMLAYQYPHIPLHIITDRIYHRLTQRFESRVNSTPFLIGWETREDNLQTNQEKFGK